MLIFRYIKPFSDSVREKYLKQDIKPVDAVITLKSTHPNSEYEYLKKSITMMKAITNSSKHRYMREDFLPKQLRPILLDNYPGSFTECCAFIDILDEYHKYMNENKQELINSSFRMTNLLQSMIVIENKEILLIINEVNLKNMLEKVCKKYEKYGIFLKEE